MNIKIVTPALGLTLFTFCLALSSCKKDSANNNASIVGKWSIVKSITWNPSSGSPIKDTSDLSSTGSYEDFHADGTVYEKYLDSYSSTYFYDTATYVVSGNTITTKDVHGYSTTAQIQGKTSSSMTLYQPMNATITYDHWLILSR